MDGDLSVRYKFYNDRHRKMFLLTNKISRTSFGHHSNIYVVRKIKHINNYSFHLFRFVSPNGVKIAV